MQHYHFIPNTQLVSITNNIPTQNLTTTHNHQNLMLQFTYMYRTCFLSTMVVFIHCISASNSFPCFVLDKIELGLFLFFFLSFPTPPPPPPTSPPFFKAMVMCKPVKMFEKGSLDIIRVLHPYWDQIPTAEKVLYENVKDPILPQLQRPWQQNSTKRQKNEHGPSKPVRAAETMTAKLQRTTEEWTWTIKASKQKSNIQHCWRTNGKWL